MTQARRAAHEVPEVTTTVSSPRRGRTTGLRGVARRMVAPTAIVGLLVATTTLTFVPVGPDTDVSLADPLAAHDERVANRASREFVRVPMQEKIPASLYSATATVETGIVTPTVAPSIAPAPSETPSVVAPAPSATTEVPETVAPVESTPAVDWSIKGETAGSRWSTASVNVRTGPGTGFEVITAMVEGRGITITETTHDGWQQISLKSGAGWIKAKFLTDKEPAAPSTVASSADKASASTPEAPAAAGNCAKAGNATNSMTQRTVSVLNTVCAQFSSIASYGGYRAGSGGYHGSGQAIDAMVSGDAGSEVASWVRDNASSLGVVEVIYAQKIWTKQRSGDGWRSMSDRGSASANHYDHVHISVG